MRLIGAFFLLILFSAQSCKTTGRNAFRIIDATKKAWAGGLPQSGAGNVYHILLRIAPSQKYAINHVWIEGKEVEFSIQNYRTLINREATKGDTIDIVYKQSFKENSTELNLKKDGLKPPFDGYSAIVAYTDEKQTTKYIKIKDFKIMEKEYYP